MPQRYTFCTNVHLSEVTHYFNTLLIYGDSVWGWRVTKLNDEAHLMMCVLDNNSTLLLKQKIYIRLWIHIQYSPPPIHSFLVSVLSHDVLTAVGITNIAILILSCLSNLMLQKRLCCLQNDFLSISVMLSLPLPSCLCSFHSVCLYWRSWTVVVMSWSRCLPPSATCTAWEPSLPMRTSSQSCPARYGDEDTSWNLCTSMSITWKKKPFEIRWIFLIQHVLCARVHTVTFLTWQTSQQQTVSAGSDLLKSL